MRTVVTYSHPDTYFQPLWRKYYAPFFDDLKIILLENEEIYNGRYIAEHFNKLLPKLLEIYSLVMRVDVDEIVVPDPRKYKDLGDYLKKFNGYAVKSKGYHILEMDGDKPLDLAEKITKQRKYWYRDSVYDKAVITKIPLKYFPGQHKTVQEVLLDEDLVMFHLRDANLQKIMERRKFAKDMPFSIGEFLNRRQGAKLIPKKWRII